MAVSSIVALTVVTAGSAYMSYKGQESAAKGARRAEEQAAEQARERAEREEQLAREKKEAEVRMAGERLEFEKKTRKEKAEFVTSQMAKRDAEVLAAAIAGYAASGLEIDEGSAMAVLNKISREAKVEQEAVWDEYKQFESARDIEFRQLKETKELTYDWFTTRLHQETQWEIANRYAEASAYRTKGKYAQYGGYLGVGGALLSGYGSYTSLPGKSMSTSPGGGFDYISYDIM